jgi:hypothetical protein
MPTLIQVLLAAKQAYSAIPSREREYLWAFLKMLREGHNVFHAAVQLSTAYAGQRSAAEMLRIARSR